MFTLNQVFGIETLSRFLWWNGQKHFAKLSSKCWICCLGLRRFTIRNFLCPHTWVRKYNKYSDEALFLHWSYFLDISLSILSLQPGKYRVGQNFYIQESMGRLCSGRLGLWMQKSLRRWTWPYEDPIQYFGMLKYGNASCDSFLVVRTLEYIVKEWTRWQAIQYTVRTTRQNLKNRLLRNWNAIWPLQAKLCL